MHSAKPETTTVRSRVSQILSTSSLGQRVFAVQVFIGFASVALINVFFTSHIATSLSYGQRSAYRAYDIGQMLALGTLCALLVLIVSALPSRVRIVAALSLVFGLCYAVLGADLGSFIARHAHSHIPFCAVFSLVSTLALGANALLSTWIAQTRMRALAIVAGLALTLGHPRVLELAYPSVHLLVAIHAALLLGPACHRLLEHRLSPRTLMRACIVLGLLVVPSVAYPAGPVVRTALLGSSGAVVAPYVAKLWAAEAKKDTATMVHSEHREWWRPRDQAAPIAPQTFAARPKKPIVVLFTIDGVRGDLIETPEWSKRLPNFTSLREHSVRFERAWSAAASTRPSLTSLFLGTFHSQQLWPDAIERQAKAKEHNHWRALPIRGQGPYLASLLEEARVRTLNIAAYTALARGRGVVEGFGKQIRLRSRAPSEKIVARMLERLSHKLEHPLFIYSHNLDPHVPYDRGGTEGTSRERYLRELEVVDRALGTLVAGVQKLGLSNRLYLIIASDHGEAFLEHGYRCHGGALYEEMIRVPLYISGPGIEPRLVHEAVSTIDLAPTILDLFRAETPGHFMGQSLVPFLAGRTPKLARPLAVESNAGLRAMLFDGHIKASESTVRGTEEVYDLANDPSEKHNLAEAESSARYLATLREYFRIHGDRPR